jgi:polar amino acid transport system substrate-binding protein
MVMKCTTILIVSSWCCLAIARANATEVNLITAAYPPYYGPNLTNHGPVTEIIVAAYKKVGYRVNIKYVPWARALEIAKSGKADGLYGAWYSAERAQWFVYSNQLLSNEIVLYKRRGTAPQTFTSYSALRSYKIGIVRGYRNPPAFEAAHLRTDTANTDATNLRKLVAKRIDLILIDRGTATYILTHELHNYRERLEAVEPPVEVLPMHLVISKKVQDYQIKRDDFNQGLELLSAAGGVEAIMQQHGMR